MEKKIVIIGAGPAGLAMAGMLRKAGIDFEIIEATDRIAHRWHNHYDRLHLHSVKRLSHLPHLEFPDDYPRYIPRLKLIEYLEDYAKQFRIEPKFNTVVSSIERIENQWIIRTNTGEMTSDAVVMATGINRIPNIPWISGQETFTGEILHSIAYKNAEKFRGKRVLVVGMGNTGAEIALDLAECKVGVGVSIRGKVSVIPRDFLGRSVQETGKLLAKLPYFIGDRIGALSSALVYGNLKKLGLPITAEFPAKLLRTQGRTPTIDLGTIKEIKKGNISVFPGIRRIEGGEIIFEDGNREAFDAIILATGYFAKLDELLESASTFDKHGEPLDRPVMEGKHLYFIGFDKYKLGGILGTLESDGQEILKDLQKDGF